MIERPAIRRAGSLPQNQAPMRIPPATRRGIRCGPAAAALVPLLVAVPPAQAQTHENPSEASDTAVVRLAPLVVTGRLDDLIGFASSASEGFIGARDLDARPITREGWSPCPA